MALHCPHCAYSLQGNTTAVCPECGAPVGRDVILRELDRFEVQFSRALRRWGILAAIVACGYTAICLGANRSWAEAFLTAFWFPLTALLAAAIDATARLELARNYRSRAVSGRIRHPLRMALGFLITLTLLSLGSLVVVIPGFVISMTKLIGE